MAELDRVIAMKRARGASKKNIRKIGTIEVGIVETTPIVWKDRLLRFGWKRAYHTTENSGLRIDGCYNFVDMETNKEIAAFAPDHSFGAAYTENEKMYVIGTEGGFGSHTLRMFVSDDLQTWESYTIFSDPEWIIYNVSLCRGEDAYILAIEISHPVSIAGEFPYTIVFARSDDMYHWELMDTDQYIYRKDRYAACPVLRYAGEYYYMIYLETLPGYNCVPYIVRSKNLHDWDIAPMNPVMFYSDEDRQIPHPEYFTEEELALITSSLNTNNSDVDLCDWNGKTVILYSWGNQLGNEFLAVAEYDGSMREFFESFF